MLTTSRSPKRLKIGRPDSWYDESLEAASEEQRELERIDTINPPINFQPKTKTIDYVIRRE